MTFLSAQLMLIVQSRIIYSIVYGNNKQLSSMLNSETSLN